MSRVPRPLTDKQRAILEYVEGYQEREGFSPSLREIAEAFGFLTPHTAADHLDALSKKGYVRRRPGTARAIVVTRRTP